MLAIENRMNSNTLLNIIERLEGLLAKLPEKIRRPVSRELTPLKELFLQQRPPRFLFIGSSEMPTHRIIDTLFTTSAPEQTNVALMPVHRWINWDIAGHGTISVLDARDAADSAAALVEEELKRQPADIIFLFDDDESNLEKPSAVRSAGSLLHLEHQFGGAIDDAKVIGVCFGKRSAAQLQEALNSEPAIRNRLLKVIQFARMHSTEVRGLLSVLTEQLPNQAKVEMIRISRDREAQHHVAQMLIKSTTAICTAIGAQPIPLADMPVLTALQVMMVSGIMYISGRERSLRAATEFMTAVGANVGAGMLLREGARAILKFFPGWGNVVCGMVAGAGTYAIGRAASAFFIGGVSLKDARQKYLASRKKASHKAHLLEDSRRASKSIE
jgi:uncharacterized protein (DUF697 family)